jgi:selenocysteine lyase/cysteine desulfurase
MRTIPPQNTSEGYSKQLNKAYEAFQQTYPAYDTTKKLDELRAKEYSRLDKLGQVYLDYTGGGIYADSQLDELMVLLKNGNFGNPHSNNPTSLASTQMDEHTRKYVLEFFNASPE